MGATTFDTTGTGKTVGEAFIDARERALWDHGHGGYTGTIAEKDSYVEAVLPSGVSAGVFIRALMNGTEMWSAGNEVLRAEVPDWAPANWRELVEAYDSKWGPCVAAKIGQDTWLFCGWAST